jgi:hypothetical protein
MIQDITSIYYLELFLYCCTVSQMEGFKLPLTRGSMDDISGETEMSERGDGTQETPLDSMSSQGAKAIYEREAQILIDYSALDEEFKEVSVPVVCRHFHESFCLFVFFAIHWLLVPLVFAL